MSDQDSKTVVVQEIVVDAPIDRAFSVFTTDMAGWWPPEHHILEAAVADIVLEPRVGGSIISKGVDGSECRWARVLAYEPPSRLAFSWDISVKWQIENDPDKTSEVEVRFIEDGPRRTRVLLEHRYLERHGDGWEAMRDAVESADGWAVGLGRYREYAASSSNATR